MSSDERQSFVDALAHPTRKTIVRLVVAVALVAGVFLLVGRMGEFGDIRAALERAEYAWLPLAVLGEVVSYAGYIYAYRDFARVREGPRLSTRLAAEVVVVGIGATAIGSAPGGLAFDYWALHKAGASRPDAARRVVGLNSVKWFSLAVLAAAAAVLAMLGEGTAPIAMAIAWLVVVAIAVGLAWLLTVGKRGARLATPPERPAERVSDVRSFVRWSRFVLREAFAVGIGGVLYVRRLYAEPRRHRAGVIGFPLYWLGDMLAFWVSLRAFGIELDLVTLTLAYATGYVATGLPLPVGGSGGVEAAMTFALTACSVPLAPALLGAVCYRLFDFWLPLIPSVIVLPRLRRIDARLTEVARGAAPD